MKKIFQKLTKPLILIFSGTILMYGCLDNDFEAPDPLDIPIGEVHTIAELRQIFADGGNQPIRFTEDVTIFGVVTMDGSSGNIFRSAFLEDNTAAINIRLTSPGGLYQGDSLRLNLRGTVLNSFENMLQIDSVHVGNNIVKIKTLVDFEPEVVNINTLLSNPGYQGRLVKLENVEFQANELGQTFADADNLLAQNRMLRDCDGNQIIVRTSGFANFADELLPEGNGSLVALVSQFRDVTQLFIRNIAEVDMEGPRCSEQDSEDIISLAEVRQLFNEGITSIPAGKSIVGVITSDRVNENIFRLNAYIQDATGAIAIRFTDTHDFNLWDRITIFAGTLNLSEFNGLLQISDVPIGNAILSETNILIEPEETTIQNILDNIDTFESRLVKIPNVTISGGTTFAGNRTLNDGTGSISLFTREDATFSDDAIPQGTVTLTGIVSIFNTPNIIIRNLDDIQQ